jgi:hypothetical protein
MKKQINEIKRMQQLAGILKESYMNEDINDKINSIRKEIGDKEEKIYEQYGDDEIDAKFDYSKEIDNILSKHKDDKETLYAALVDHLEKLNKEFPTS